MRKLLIRQDGKTYRFLQFEFRDHSDGSLIIIFDRQSPGLESIVWTNKSESCPETRKGSSKQFRISYHTTGRVNFHGMEVKPIYCEPIFAITEPQWLSTISVPALERLTKKPESQEMDAIIELPPQLSGRLTFSLVLMPDHFAFQSPPLALINYQTWFGLAVLFATLPLAIPSGCENHVIKVRPIIGRYQTQQFSQAQALIAFHKKRAGSSGGVTYWEPNGGIYRIIFSVPMRIPPRLSVEFMDPNIRAEVLAPTKPATAMAEICFRARGPGGYLTSPQAVRSIELDAEL